MALPDFLVIGAMKCGTSTLAAQLGAQPGIFMTEPKEPNFFSDNRVYAKGLDWYRSLFSAAGQDDLKGEASTHYTKLPTHPETIARAKEVLESPRLVYLIRDPVARAVSHYIHEWTMGIFTEDFDTSLDAHPEIVEYGRYAMQVRPWIDAFGADAVQVESLETMKARPQEVLERVAAHIGYTGSPAWTEEQARVNASAERIRRFPLHGLLVDNPIASAVRRTLVPQGLRDRVKRARQMQDRPAPSEAAVQRMQTVFAEDYAALKGLFPDRPDLALSYPFVPHD